MGAGAAGLSAAKSLLELSTEVDVVVLEGRDRIGGRIFTTQLPDGSRVDLGASYVHGCNREDNYVFNLAKEANVTLAREYGGYQAGWLSDALWFDLRGKRICQADLQKAWSVFEAVSECLSEKANDLHMMSMDMSVSEYLVQHLPKHLERQLVALNDVSSMVFNRLVSTVWGYVGPVERLSARLMAHQFVAGDEDDDIIENGEFEDEDALVVSGYDFLIQRLSKGVDIRIKKVYRKVIHALSV